MRTSIVRSSRRGLTLLEVTLGLAVAGIVLIGVYEIAMTTFAITGEVEQGQATAVQEEAFIHFLKREFRELPARARIGLSARKEGRVYASALQISDAPLAFNFARASGFSRVELQSNPVVGDQLRVLLRYTNDDESVRDLILFREVTELSWRVYDRDRREWVPTWDDQRPRPDRIELQIGLNGEPPYRYLFYIPALEAPSNNLPTDGEPPGSNA